MPTDEPKNRMERVNDFIAQYFLWCVLLILFFIFFFGWFFLLQTEWKTIQHSGILGNAEAVNRLDERQKYLADLQDMQNAYDDLGIERLAQIYSVLPVGLEPTRTIRTIQALAESANMSILSIDVVDQQPGNADSTGFTNGADDSEIVSFESNSIRTAIVTLNLQGQEDTNYQDVKRFLDILQNYVPVLNLQTMTYAADTTSFALQLETYYLNERSQ